MSPRLFYIAIGLAGLLAIALLIRHTGNSLPSFGSDQFAYAIYMGIWATLIGSAVIARPEGIGHSLKQLVIWVGIFLCVMTAYTYRYELQDVASTVTGGLVPGSPISGESVEGREQVTLIRDRDGNFVARAQINDNTVSFLVDTGATEIVLSHADAERAGIDTGNLIYSIPVSTANGMTTAARASLDSLAIGKIALPRTRVMVAKKGNLNGSLLGMSFINRLYSFEIRGDRMIMTR